MDAASETLARQSATVDSSTGDGGEAGQRIAGRAPEYMGEGSADEPAGWSAEQHTVRVQDHYTLYLFAAIHCLFAYIHRLSDVGGDDLQRYFERYPFLEEYSRQTQLVQPGGLDWAQGLQWWKTSLADLARHTGRHLPLKVLADILGFDHENLLALMLAGLVEEDSRFGTLFADLQQPLGYRRPMLETLGNVVTTPESASGRSAWDICKPLLDSQLVEADNRQQPRSEWLLKVRGSLWDTVRAGNPPSDLAGAKFTPREQLTPLESVIAEPGFHAKLCGVPRLFEQRLAGALILRAPEGSHSTEATGAVAAALGKSLMVIEPAQADAPGHRDGLGVCCALLNAMPVHRLDLGPGDTVAMPVLAGYTGPQAVILGEEGGLEAAGDEQLVNLVMPRPDMGQRMALWLRHLQGCRVDSVDTISRQFRLPGDFVRQVAQIARNNAALEARHTVTLTDVREAARNLNHQKLDTLADPLEARGSWSQLICASATGEKLDELEQRCHYREQLLDHLGPAFRNSSNCGVRALFTGRSGTGKTLAAKILAAELGMDIYRVDLASIVNKYIGETEKNLNKVLTRAEALDVILLLDEGDALLGGRTEVKNANDRYANLETNYLLQRLEHYQGIILVTTNLSENIDKAFQRRMDIVVPFFQPQMEQRLAIFQLHMPDSHQVGGEMLQRVANYCGLMGGQIRNVCLHASLLALDEKSEVKNRHLELALRSEYRKNGGTYPLDEQGSRAADDGGMGAFANALARQCQ